MRHRGRRFGVWARTAAWYRVPGVAGITVALGLGAGRADLVILTIPMLIGWVLALIATRPMLGRRAPTATSAVDPDSFGANEADVEITVQDLDSVELVSVTHPGRDTGPIGEMTTLPGGPAQGTLRARFRSAGWGHIAVTRADSLGAGPDGLYLLGAVRYAPTRTELILPAVSIVPPISLPPLSGGWAGVHVSRRPGQGSDLVDLREFAPGDRLRQVHWRAYARHQRLYTRRTLSDAEAEIMFCLDLSRVYQPRAALPEVGRWEIAVARLRRISQRWGDRWLARRDPDAFNRRLTARRRVRESSVDHTVNAVAALAGAHLSQGDRVGMLTATVPQHLVRAGAGNRQLQRIRHQLALITDRHLRMLDMPLWGLSPGQIVVWCSPMTTDAAFQTVAECIARGHLVIVVDTLPLTGLISFATEGEVDHLRVLTVQRELALQRLRGRGVAVLNWESPDLERQLLEASRILRSRRVRV